MDKQQDRIQALRDLMDNAPDFIEWKIREALELPQRKRPQAVMEIASWITHRKAPEQERYIDRIVEVGLSKRRMMKNLIKDAQIEKAKAAKAERMKKAEETLSPDAFLRMQIEEFRKNRFRKAFQIKRDVSNLIIDDMKIGGRFYQTQTRQFYWFDNDGKELYQIGDDWLGVYINHHYSINQSEAEYEFLIHDLRTLAAMNGEKTEVHQFAFYDKENHLLYIYNNANQMYRLDGESIELIDNGKDGVLFLGNPLHELFIYKPNVTNQILPLIINPIPFARGGEVNLNPDEQRQIFMIWIYTIFFESLLPTKPLQFFLGEKGSGKTTRQRIIGKWFYGKHFDVQPVNKDKEDSFVTAITNNQFVAFDNVDTNISWLPDRLAQVATGQRIQLRELYTTNTERVYFPKCFVSLNAREPKFKRDDVVDRLLLFRVDRLEGFRAESAILGEIADHRNVLWSELIDDLNQIVAALKNDHEPFMSQFRMADWAELGWRIAKTNGNGNEFIRLLDKMDKAQNEFLMEDNPIFEYLNEWLEKKENVGREVKVSELFADFQTIAEGKKVKFAYQTPRSLGRQLRQIISNLTDYFEISERQVQRAWHYTFEPKSEN